MAVQCPNCGTDLELFSDVALFGFVQPTLPRVSSQEYQRFLDALVEGGKEAAKVVLHAWAHDKIVDAIAPGSVPAAPTLGDYLKIMRDGYDAYDRVPARHVRCDLMLECLECSRKWNAFVRLDAFLANPVQPAAENA